MFCLFFGLDHTCSIQALLLALKSGMVLLARFEGSHIRYYGLNLGWLHANHEPCPLYYHSNPGWGHFYLCSCKNFFFKIGATPVMLGAMGYWGSNPEPHKFKVYVLSLGPHCNEIPSSNHGAGMTGQTRIFVCEII